MSKEELILLIMAVLLLFLLVKKMNKFIRFSRITKYFLQYLVTNNKAYWYEVLYNKI